VLVSSSSTSSRTTALCTASSAMQCVLAGHDVFYTSSSLTSNAGLCSCSSHSGRELPAVLI
jgi:hypothetical protein